MKRQILQNVISFEKPKTVLVDVTYDYGNNKKVQAVDVRSLGGYIVCTEYEYGTLLNSKTLYIDRSGEVDREINKILEYIPDEISFEKLMKLIGNLNCDIYREHPLTVTHHFSRGMYDLCSDAIQLGVNIKFPKEFYEEKNTILLNLKTYHKGGGIYMHLSCDGVVNSRGSFIERMYLNHCGEYERLFPYICYELNKLFKEEIMKIVENYVFFWGDYPFSNFSETPIVLEDFIMVDGIGQEKEVVLPTSEHYFMLRKALFFNDIDIAGKIIETPLPRDAKKFGRQVSGFKERENAMMDALRLKFTQSEEARNELLNTKYLDKSFVEASPIDSIWGIGMGENDPNRLDTSKWGLNLLGKCLDRIRQELQTQNI